MIHKISVMLTRYKAKARHSKAKVTGAKAKTKPNAAGCKAKDPWASRSRRKPAILAFVS